MWLAVLVAMTGNPVTISTSALAMVAWYRWSRRFVVPAAERVEA